MLNKKLAGCLAASAVVALLAAASTANAQIAPPDRIVVYHYYGTPKYEPGDDPANWSARQNVVDSDRYERLIQTNPAFRAARIRKECGSINEPDLYQQCVASFY
jgi:ABC-type transport system substrate-binding protein